MDALPRLAQAVQSALPPTAAVDVHVKANELRCAMTYGTKKFLLMQPIDERVPTSFDESVAGFVRGHLVNVQHVDSGDEAVLERARLLGRPAVLNYVKHRRDQRKAMRWLHKNLDIPLVKLQPLGLVDITARNHDESKAAADLALAPALEDAVFKDFAAKRYPGQTLEAAMEHYIS